MSLPKVRILDQAFCESACIHKVGKLTFTLIVGCFGEGWCRGSTSLFTVAGHKSRDFEDCGFLRFLGTTSLSTERVPYCGIIYVKSW